MHPHESDTHRIRQEVPKYVPPNLEVAQSITIEFLFGEFQYECQLK
jgi:hypothetical protein